MLLGPRLYREGDILDAGAATRPYPRPLERHYAAREVRVPLPLAEPPPEKSKKLPVLQLQAVILQLCAGRWLSASELAALVDRDAEKLRSRFLTAMVKNGVPELRYPDDHHGLDQVYRAVQGDAAVGG